MRLQPVYIKTILATQRIRLQRFIYIISSLSKHRLRLNLCMLQYLKNSYTKTIYALQPKQCICLHCMYTATLNNVYTDNLCTLQKHFICLKFVHNNYLINVHA